MATVAVTSDNHRWDTMDATTNVTSIGGGAGAVAEPDFYYQGAGSVSRKVSSATGAGFYTNTGANRDFTAAGQVTWMAKVLVTNSAALNATGLVLRIGSGTGAYYEYLIADNGSNLYPAKESWLIVPIDPNIAGYRSSTTGSPTLTACAYFAAVGAFSATSKGENLALDAVDAGTGLYLVGGDGASADGLFSDFTADDEGDVSNGRFGYVHTKGGVLFINGTLYFGKTETGTTTATVFTDSDKTLIFQDSRTAAGFNSLNFDLGNATTVITFTGINVIGRGDTTTTDTRPQIVATGTSGSLDVNSGSFENCSTFTLTTACNFDSTKINNSGQITAAGATFTNNTVSSYTGSSDTSALVWNVATDPDGLLDGTTFTKGTGSTHAIEFGTSSPTTMTLTNVNFSGYNASNGQTDSAIHVKRTTGTVTINIDGGSTPSYKTDGATVVIVSGTVTVDVTVKTTGGTAIQDARVFLPVATGGPFPYQALVTIANSGTTATVTHTAHGLATNDKIWIEGASHAANNGVFTITVSDANTYTYTMSSTPGSNPTGTITSTFVVLSGLTNASGILSMSRVFSSAQPVSGWVRKSSATPFYKTTLISGSVSSTTGASFTSLMILDE